MTTDTTAPPRPHSSHWGAFSAYEDAGQLVVVPHPDDPDPSSLLQNIPQALRHPARIAQPMVRRGWLDRGPRSDPKGTQGRGREDFVAMDWPQMLDLLAAELRRVYDTHGAEAVFGGSYGWASAGRFHHAQSQVHRFLNTLGGYVRSVNSYSAGASAVILPHVSGAVRGCCKTRASMVGCRTSTPTSCWRSVAWPRRTPCSAAAAPASTSSAVR